MRIGSLFSGAGGLDMAAEHLLDGHTVWHCENDTAASKVLAARWPGVPNHHDVTAVDWGQVEPVDVICGGWPCQPFSLAGKRKGADDERALWPYVAGAVRMVRPRIIVLENVSAVLGPEFARVANDLAAFGYDIAWTCLRASDVGAPHRRERVFILAYAASDRLEGHDARTSLNRSRGGWEGNAVGSAGTAHAAHPARDGRHEGRPEPARLIGGSDAAVGGDGPVELLPTPRSSDCFGAGMHGDGGMDLRTTVSLLPTPRSHRRGDCESERNRNDPDLEATTHHFPGGQWGKYEPAIRRWEQVTRPAPAPTEPNTKGNPRLSAAFSEWMLGWPPGWVTDIDISRNDQLRIIGNGVVPQQAQAALRWLLDVAEVAA